MPTPKKPMPDDFAQVVLTMPRHDLARHYGTSYRAVQRWIAEAGVNVSFRQGVPASNRRPVPDDWEQNAPTMAKFALMKLYRTSDTVIDRWAAETGVAPKPYKPTNPLSRMGQHHRVKIATQSPRSMAEMAADDLRRERFTIHRCNERGRFDLKGKYWRLGFSIITDDELLVRAAKYRREG